MYLMLQSLCPHHSHLRCLHLRLCPIRTLSAMASSSYYSYKLGCTLSLASILPCVLMAFHVATIKFMAKPTSGSGGGAGGLAHRVRRATVHHHCGRAWQEGRGCRSHHAHSQQTEKDRKWGWARKQQGLSQRPISSVKLCLLKVL